MILPKNCYIRPLLLHFFTALSLVLLLAGCTPVQSHDESPVGESLSVNHVSSLTLSQDGSVIWIGTSDDVFYGYNPSRNTLSRYDLPPGGSAKTYCVYDIGGNCFFVGRKNMGLLLVKYDGADSDNIPVAFRRIPMPSGELPVKGNRFSVYQMARIGNRMVCGSSNGLFYLVVDSKSPELTTLSDVSELRPVKPLEHLREHVKQFAQECVFAIGDSAVVSVTDNGIWLVDGDDFDNADTDVAVNVGEGRYWAATVHDNVLYTLRSALKNQSRELCSYSFPLWKHKNPVVEQVDVSALVVGLYGNKVVALGEENSENLPKGDYTCANSWVDIGGSFYYISDGQVRVIDTSSDNISQSNESIAFDLGEYVISNRNGVWRKDGQSYTFIGEFSRHFPVRAASFSPGSSTIYIASQTGLYSLSTERTWLPSHRDLKIEIANNPNDADRIESILALDDKIIVGSRNGLKSYNLPHTGETKPVSYIFHSLDSLYESPYVVDIRRAGDTNSCLVETLNHGVWRLDLTTGRLSLTDISSLRNFGVSNTSTLPERPTLTWEYVRERAWMIVVSLCALLGAILALVYFFKAVSKRHLQKAGAENRRSYSDIKKSLDALVGRLGGSQLHQSLVAMLARHRRDIDEFLAQPSEVRLREKADRSILVLKRLLSDDIIARVDALASSFKANLDKYSSLKHHNTRAGRILRLMDAFAGDIAGCTAFDSSMSVVVLLKLATVRYDFYLSFEHRLLALLKASRLRGSLGRQDEFPASHLDELWRLCQLLDTTGAIDMHLYPIYDVRNDDGIPFGRYTFVSLLFYNLAKPLIEGCEPLRDSARAVYNFSPVRDSRGYNNHGSAYKIVARAISEGCLSGNPRPLVVISLADLVWYAYFSTCHQDIRGLRSTSGIEKSLYTAITGAHTLAR